MPDLTDAEFSAALAALKSGQQNDALDRASRMNDLKSQGASRRARARDRAALLDSIKSDRKNKEA
ncbi:hypothetical protein ACNHYB_06155 [Isoptericola jiangsuensis]|uniref:hypothetical protein n=1 Tax=Isoptericola jiangsuensis TaxID=548579 RepID=UPI003AAD44D7